MQPLKTEEVPRTDKAKVAVTLDWVLLKRVDRSVRKAVLPNRSQAMQDAVVRKSARQEHGRLARECAKLDRREERALANAGWAPEAEWPKY